jgi:hypothetical protein
MRLKAYLLLRSAGDAAISAGIESLSGTLPRSGGHLLLVAFGSIPEHILAFSRLPVPSPGDHFGNQSFSALKCLTSCQTLRADASISTLRCTCSMGAAEGLELSPQAANTTESPRDWLGIRGIPARTESTGPAGRRETCIHLPVLQFKDYHPPGTRGGLACRQYSSYSKAL